MNTLIKIIKNNKKKFVILMVALSLIPFTISRYLKKR